MKEQIMTKILFYFAYAVAMSLGVFLMIYGKVQYGLNWVMAAQLCWMSIKLNKIDGKIK